MSKAFVTATARSTPFLPNRGIDAQNVQDAIEKLAFLSYASSMAGAIYTEDGDVTIRIGIAETSLVLPSSTGRWRVSVNDSGNLVSQMLDSSDQSLITYWRFKREDGTSVAAEITDDGEIIMANPPDYVGITIKNFYLKSPSGHLFLLGTTNDGEFYTESTNRPPNPKFRVISQDDQVLFSTVEHRDLAFNYMPIYSIDNLPAKPVSMADVVPMAFIKSGSAKKPIYHDGVTWRYLNTDALVVHEAQAAGETTDASAGAPINAQSSLLIPSSVGFWQLRANDSGQISTTRHHTMNNNDPFPQPVLVSSPVGIWYVSANESGGVITQLISGAYQSSQIKLSSESYHWEILADSIGELFLQRIQGV